MAALAEFINRIRFAHHQHVRSRRVNRVARRTSHLILGMAALQPADMRRLIQVTSEANLIDGSRGELSWIPNISGVGRPGMLRPRPVARFASLPVESPLFIGAIRRMMSRLRECLTDIFMTDSTCLRSNVR